MRKTNENKKQQGFTLIETMVAVGVVMVGFTSALSLVSSSLYYVSNIQNRLIAANLAGEGIEIVRNIRDNNWLNNRIWNEGLSDGDYQASYDSLTLAPYDGDSILYDSTGKFYNYIFGDITPFVRKITIEKGPKSDLDIDEMRVVSSVIWQRSGRTYTILVEDHIYNWK